MSAQDKADNESQQIENLGESQEEDLDSIMQELESLDNQRDQAPADAAPAATTASMAAKTESNGVAAVPMRAVKGRAKSAANGAIAQSLTLELTGTLNLKLGFVTGTKSVELICTDEALVCRFGDGTEVRIPTENPRATTFRRTA